MEVAGHVWMTLQMRRTVAVVAGFILLGPLTIPLPAHGEDQLLIDALTEEIARAPEADLFIRRGELLRQHEEWARADADFSLAARLDPALTLVDYFRARLWLEAREPGKAQDFVDQFLKRAPDDVEGWLLRGDVLAARGEPAAGAAAYDEGIRRAKHPEPQHFIRRARFLAGLPDSNPARVLAAIDEGINRVGPALALVDLAIALELETQNYDGALARIRAAKERAARRESWLIREAAVLLKLQRRAEAADAYRAAVEAIARLPASTRVTAATEQLERDAREGLARASTR